MTKVLITTWLCLVCLTSFAQANLAKDLAAVNHAYFQLNKKMTVKAVASNGDQKVETNYVAYMKNIDHYFMKSEGTEMLISSSVKVVKNEAMNAIMIDSNATNSIDELPIQLFDTLTRLYSSVKHTKLQAGYERYELVPVVERVKKIVVEFNSTTKLLRRMEMQAENETGQASYLTITYQYHDLVESDIPPITHYLDFDTAGIAQLSAAYKNYKLINFLNR
ncbi:MAG: hypothetical protein JJ975_08450 [Bacteroidia bacterium]|nr:hypothetical protein [Bacteroidia bacterium]